MIPENRIRKVFELMKKDKLYQDIEAKVSKMTKRGRYPEERMQKESRKKQKDKKKAGIKRKRASYIMLLKG